MYYEIEWIEEKNCNYRRVFRAKDFDTFWKAIRYLNIARRDNNCPVMKRIRLKEMDKYEGRFSDIIGNFDADMELETDRRQEW